MCHNYDTVDLGTWTVRELQGGKDGGREGGTRWGSLMDGLLG